MGRPNILDYLVENDSDVDVLVAKAGSGAIGVQPFPIANPWLELNAEQMREAEDGRALTLRVGMDRVWPQFCGTLFI